MSRHPYLVCKLSQAHPFSTPGRHFYACNMSFGLRTRTFALVSTAARSAARPRALRPLARFHHCDGAEASPLDVDNQSKKGEQPLYGPIGVTAALHHSPNGTCALLDASCERDMTDYRQLKTDPAPSPTLFQHEFSLADRVAVVSGGNRGLGLEMALALIEAGVRAVYCVDLAKEPSEEWQKVREYAAKMTGKGGEGRLEYISGNVTDQVRVCFRECSGVGES